MRLSKWYLDCIADDGEVFIGYVATLRGLGAALAYSAVLTWREGEVREHASLRALGGGAPSIDDRGVSWASRSLSVSGVWTRHGPPLDPVTLLETRHGAVTWTCHAPGAAVRLEHGGSVVEGLGYAEHLDLGIRPWDLPIDTLHWGRFVAPGESIVWIRWEGEHPLTIVYRNGVAAAAADVGRDHVTLDDARLSLDDAVVLREGSLGDTVLRRVPLVVRLLPKRMLDTVEKKWRSRAVLTGPGGLRREGWAIHEVVEWA